MTENFNIWLDEIKSSKTKKEAEYYQNEPKYPKTFLDVSNDQEMRFWANLDIYGIIFNFKDKTFQLINIQGHDDGPDHEGTFEFDDKTITLHFLYEIDNYAMTWEEKRNFKKDENYEGVMSCFTGRIKGVKQINKKQRFNYLLVQERIEHPKYDEFERTHLTLKIDKTISPPYIFGDYEEEMEDDLEVSDEPEFEKVIYDPFYGDNNIQYYKTFYTHSLYLPDILERYKKEIVNKWLDIDWDYDDHLKKSRYSTLMSKIKEGLPEFPIDKLDLDFLRKNHGDEEFLYGLYDKVFRNLVLKLYDSNYPVPVYAKDGEIILIGNWFSSYNTFEGKPHPNEMQILWIKVDGFTTIITSTKPELVFEQFNWKEETDFEKWDKFFLHKYFGIKTTHDYDRTKVLPFIEFLFKYFF